MSNRNPELKAQRRSRHKVELEPISIDELLNGAGMSGFTGILEPPVQVPHLQRLVDEIKDLPLSEVTPELIRGTLPQVKELPASTQHVLLPSEEGTVSLSASVTHNLPDVPHGPKRLLDLSRTSSQTVTDFDKFQSNTPDQITTGDSEPNETNPAQSHTGERGRVSLSTPESLSLRLELPKADSTRKVRRCVLAQDGHSSGEELLYQALWNARIAQQETRETKLITIGWKVMSRVARLTPRNTKRNCQNLIAKLALELVSKEDSENRIGRTYRLFSYKAILERRSIAGLEWVTRTRGVEFVASPEQSSRLSSKETTKFM